MIILDTEVLKVDNAQSVLKKRGVSLDESVGQSFGYRDLTGRNCRATIIEYVGPSAINVRIDYINNELDSVFKTVDPKDLKIT